MKIADPSLGLDEKARMLLAILSTRELALKDGETFQTKAYYEGRRGWILIRLVAGQNFCKQVLFGQDWNTDQILVTTWDISVEGPPNEDEESTRILFPATRVHEAVEFLIREFRDAYEMMQKPEGYKRSRLEHLMED